MILILLPLPALSQTANINLGSKTVTLDEAKVIDVAKIIQNEQRLKQENEELLKTIQLLNDKIQQVTQENITGLENIQQQNTQILSLSNDIQRYAALQLKTEESKNYTGKLFMSIQYDLNNPYYKAGNIKASYIYHRFSYGITVNPLNNSLIYGIEIGIAIF